MKTTRPEKPLFIPLKREFYEAFAQGDKQEEFRLYGKRWNENTCRIGRPVTLSLGYGKANRMQGRVVSFKIDESPDSRPGWVRCYGENQGPAACIGIEL